MTVTRKRKPKIHGDIEVVYADPAWSYSNKASRGAADNHYHTTTLADMKALPVSKVTAENAILFMWFTGPFASEAKELATAWGFKVKNNKGFTWVKLNKLAKQHIDKAFKRGEVADYDSFMALLNKQTFMGAGNYTRQNSEDCLVATKGKLFERLAANIKQVVFWPHPGKHSSKPPMVRKHIETLYGNRKRLEMFARVAEPGWMVWGDQAPDGINLIEYAEQFHGKQDNLQAVDG